ncbi:NAD-dependent epimerase/dehydratase family protein, partial [Escherichia coli]|nr:NAD-dependent epimerase/dehydratase family protein [Escherichia coli]
VSSHAESDFDLGMKVNFEATRQLLEVARAKNPAMKFIFISSLAVFGGELPDVITDLCVVNTQSSYGAQKAMCELMVNDYSRKGYVDG